MRGIEEEPRNEGDDEADEVGIVAEHIEDAQKNVVDGVGVGERAHVVQALLVAGLAEQTVDPLADVWVEVEHVVHIDPGDDRVRVVRVESEEGNRCPLAVRRNLVGTQAHVLVHFQL